MPARLIPLVNQEIYHIYNRSINSVPIFASKNNCQRALELISYYQFAKTPLSFSKLKKLSVKRKTEILHNLSVKDERQIKIFSFCLMPNHFHFLLEQAEEKGISKFLANFQNGYARYFNLKNHRIGPLFQGAFKAVRIETDEQLLHVSRYIHLNPYSSLVVKSLRELEEYPWGSLREFIGLEEEKISFPKKILDFFKSPAEYQQFVFDQADYQRELETVKHLVLE